MDQRSEEWFSARLGKVTASRIADVIAKTKSGPSASRGNYAVELALERITNQRRESFASTAMQRGTDLEPEARGAYEIWSGNLVNEVGFVDHPIILMSGASPDGLICDDGLLEIKCPGGVAHLETLTSKKVPGKYRPQVQWQMACTAREWCDFVSYNPDFPGRASLICIREERDATYIATLEEEVIAIQSEVATIVTLIEAMM